MEPMTGGDETASGQFCGVCAAEMDLAATFCGLCGTPAAGASTDHAIKVVGASPSRSQTISTTISSQLQAARRWTRDGWSKLGARMIEKRGQRDEAKQISAVSRSSRDTIQHDIARVTPYIPLSEVRDPELTKPSEPGWFLATDGRWYPPEMPQPVAVQSGFRAAGDQKFMLVAALLALFVGTLGVHKFYLGYTGKAVAMLLVTVISLGFLAPIVFLIAFVDAIHLLNGYVDTDARGRPLL